MDLQKMAAVLCTLEETGGSPESMLYLFYDSDMETWYDTRSQLLRAKLIEIKANYVTLTPIGSSMARDINAMLSARGLQ